MRLKRLELFGFKSFADRMAMSFDHDLVGIVGPNGCGKSNVVDAVRWVLGEQRPTSMRGTEMVDVIFKGSASRPPLAVAEVTIVLDNTSGVLEGRGNDVSVTRRVYRSGEGEYLIDGERVRLKDVREMFYGTGLGSRGYSVLEQGKIDAVLSANAQDRRAIFEEAAGVSFYRQRKKETESRLARVEADLRRLDDLLGELRTRERSLKIQAGRARRYVEARDAYQVDGLRLARHQASRLAERIAAEARALVELEAELAARREKRGTAEEDVQTREREQAALSSEIDRLSAESAELAAEIRAMDERRAQVGARIEAWRAGAREEGQRAEELERRHARRCDEATALDLEIEEKNRALDEANDRVHLLAQEASALGADYQGACETFERQNELVLGLLSERTTAKNRVQHLEASIPALSQRKERAEERLDEARSEGRVTGEQVEEAALLVRRLEERLRGGEAALGELAREEERMRQERSDLDLRRSELLVERAGIRSHIEALEEWERGNEGSEAGMRELLGALAEGRGPALSSELQGLLADHIHAEADWARALDAALGARAEGLIVARPDDAVRILAWLKARQRGRLDVLIPGALDEGTRPDAELLAQPGVLGRLFDVARPEPGTEGLIEALLGDVVRVEDVERGLELARSRPGLRFVTAEGDLVDAFGIGGGHVELAQGAVGRRSLVAELRREEAGVAAELARVEQELGGQQEAETRLSARIGELRAALDATREERTDAIRTLDAARARLDELERSLELSVHECETLDSECDVLYGELDAAREVLAELERRQEDERARLAELEEHRKALEAERNQRVRDEGQARIEVTGLMERRSALNRRRTDLSAAIEELAAERERATRLEAEHRANAERGDEELVRLAATRDGMLERRGELEELVVELREREHRGREAIESLRRHGESITGELEALLGRVAEIKLEKQRLELQRDEIGRRAQEDFGVAPVELLRGFVPDADLADEVALQALTDRVHEQRTSLEKLGPVNLEAVEELDEISGRLSFLDEQRGDLDGARRSLEGTLKKLDAESERRFVETFETIRDQFRSLFRQLFGGGRADVTLTPGQSVLEAGIEITARPPGRETLPITLLSGGQRTLTALALLFAVFRTNPSPFCILDEVDAALDDANIGRFLSLLERSLGETQYVVVTHNKGTMAACQVLYGVTMAVRGVSHVVSVQLEDVDDFVPRPAAAPGPSSEAEARPREAGTAARKPPRPPAEPRAGRVEERVSSAAAGDA